MNTEVKRWSEQKLTALYLGLGALIMASFLTALLSRFPAAAFGQATWMFTLFEILNSLVLMVFGFVQFRRVAAQETFSALNADHPNLSPDALRAKRQRYQTRAEVYSWCLLCLFTPVSLLNKAWFSLFLFARALLTVILLALLFINFIQFIRIMWKYRQQVSPEIRRVDKYIRQRANFLLFPAIVFAITIIVVYSSSARFYGESWTLEPEQGQNLVIVALIPILIQFAYVYRLTRRRLITT